MAKYSAVSIFDGQSWEGVALFADKTDFDAMVNFCVEQFQNGNSVTTPAKNIAITDLDTGEVLWDYCHDFEPQDDDPDWDDDYWDDGCSIGNEDCGFDPYLGCYTDDC